MTKPLPRWMMQNFPSNSTDHQIRNIIADLWPDGLFATIICKQCGRFTCKDGVAGNYLNAKIVSECVICKAEKDYDEKQQEQIMG